MLVCHRYQFIFIKPRKTASTSLEIALSKVCGPGDIVTPLAREDEQLRRLEGGQPPVNFRPRRWYLRPSWWQQALRDGKAPRLFKGHTPAVSARTRLPAQVWRRYTKIAVTRNPWDMAVSHYYWRLRELDKQGDTRQQPTLGEHVRTLYREQPDRLTNWHLMADGGELLMDRVLRYEELTAEVERLRQELALPERFELPRERAKGQHRKDPRNYRELLGPDERTLIGEVAAREIEAFGHTW